VSALRILFSATGFYKVGDYFRYKALAERLARAGHSITVLCGEPTFRLRLARTVVGGVTWMFPPYLGGLPTIEVLTAYLPETKLPYDVLYRTYHLARWSGSYDIVHSFHVGLNTYLPIVAARRRGRRPVRVFDWCDLWDNGIISPPRTGWLRRLDYHWTVALERRSVRTADAVTCNNAFLKRRAEEFGASPVRIAMVPDGADSDAIRPLDRTEARARLGLPVNGFLLGFAGFFHPDAELLLESVSRVRARFGDTKLLMVGSMPPHVHRRIVREGLSPAILFAGRVEKDSLAVYLAACDVLLLPFTNRPVNLARWPSKLGDYLSAGRCVVAGGFGEVERFFHAYPDIGIACDGTATSFAEAVLALLQDPARRSRGELAARAAAVEALSWDAITADLVRFYLQLLDEVE
jgi:glycosyltransferase involved in cell wall biosynthesis